ncbi:S8 family serine peptidase [Saccharothrix variisporea]|uniref:S8 family serine peptidase n=1 Tax=Saccharothrix variisporea TaxID=543527 RepID=UPI001476B305|nr:S8 family serine peptidase [Saccharothrix variisporea]
MLSAGAVRAPGTPEPRSTAYRTAVLLFPKAVLDHPDVPGQIDSELGALGLTMKDDNNELPSAVLPDELTVLGDALDRVPVPVVLRPSEQTDRVVAVDAWVALQQIRAGVHAQRISAIDHIDLISIEHLLTGTRYGGVPTWQSHDTRATAPRVAYPMMPVAYGGPRPVRDPAFPKDRRRVVIAVPDTGVNQHPWLGAHPNQVLAADSFLRTFAASEKAIKAQNTKLHGLVPTEVIEDSWEAPMYVNALAEELGRATGHFTFIAGLIHQHAPEADVLAIRVLHTDNIGYEADLLLALWLIVARVIEARNDPTKRDETVDIVSLSLGAYLEHDSGKVSHIREVLTELAAHGVLVVAAAGNDCTTRAFFPAAFAAELDVDGPGPKVVGVGALNPDGTEAWFSNAGPNVTVNATGANVVSTFPITAQGARGSGMTTTDGKQTPDPDKFAGGFAVASGTSYAVPEVTAALAGLLTAPAEGSEGIDDIRAEAMRARAVQAIRKLRGR